VRGGGEIGVLGLEMRRRKMQKNKNMGLIHID
jgi:hypothetical protein